MIYLLRCVGQMNLRQPSPITPDSSCAQPEIFPSLRKKAASDTEIRARDALRRTYSSWDKPMQIITEQGQNCPLNDDFVRITFLEKIASSAV